MGETFTPLGYRPTTSSQGRCGCCQTLANFRQPTVTDGGGPGTDKAPPNSRDIFASANAAADSYTLSGPCPAPCPWGCRGGPSAMVLARRRDPVCTGGAAQEEALVQGSVEPPPAWLLQGHSTLGAGAQPLHVGSALGTGLLAQVPASEGSRSPFSPTLPAVWPTAIPLAGVRGRLGAGSSLLFLVEADGCPPRQRPGVAFHNQRSCSVN